MLWLGLHAGSKKARSRRASRSSSPIWHSHRVSSPQPSRRRAFLLFRSRSFVRSSFSRQNAWCDAGRLRPERQLWPCQKQPFTKMTLRRPAKTRSGVPGSDRSWSRYRYPILWASLLTSSSGFVSLLLTRAIRRLRCSAVSLSIGVSQQEHYSDSCFCSGREKSLQPVGSAWLLPPAA